jgi:hypothetical protein
MLAAIPYGAPLLSGIHFAQRSSPAIILTVESFVLLGNRSHDNDIITCDINVFAV